MTAMMNRDDARVSDALAWLAALGIGDVDIAIASADASFRRYFRLVPRDGAFSSAPFAAQASMILMDAPPSHEDSRPFVSVARQLAAMQLPAPTVMAENFEQGFFLLSDLGDTALLSVLDATPSLASAFYAQAGALLHTLQAQGAHYIDTLPPYDEALLMRELALFRDWLCGTHLALEWRDDDERQWHALCAALVRNALQQPRVYVHRDFHSRNLMVADDMSLSIIDFQDAVVGAFTYDLASLLRDCYVAWPLPQVRDWARDWFDACPLADDVDEVQKLRWLMLTATQRHIKAAGIFARLGHRDGKWHYLDDVPRTLGYIVELGGDYPELRWLQELITARILPRLAS